MLEPLLTRNVSSFLQSFGAIPKKSYSEVAAHPGFHSMEPTDLWTNPKHTRWASERGQ